MRRIARAASVPVAALAQHPRHRIPGCAAAAPCWVPAWAVAAAARGASSSQDGGELPSPAAGAATPAPRDAAPDAYPAPTWDVEELVKVMTQHRAGGAPPAGADAASLQSAVVRNLRYSEQIWVGRGVHVNHVNHAPSLEEVGNVLHEAPSCFPRSSTVGYFTYRKRVCSKPGAKEPRTCEEEARMIAEWNAGLSEPLIMYVPSATHIGVVAAAAADRDGAAEARVAMRHHDPSCIVVSAGVREPGGVFAKMREFDDEPFGKEAPSRFFLSARCRHLRFEPVILSTTLILVTGSGGSGKTTFMLAARSPDDHTLVTFLIPARDITDFVDGKRRADSGEACPSQRDVITQPIVASSDAEVVRAREWRNAAVAEAVVWLVERAVAQLSTAAAMPLRRARALVRLRVAIDDADGCEGLVRAVAAKQDEIRAGVREACRLGVHVELMIGGTGCGAPTWTEGSGGQAIFSLPGADRFDLGQDYGQRFMYRFAAPLSTYYFYSDARDVPPPWLGAGNLATVPCGMAAIAALACNPRIGARMRVGNPEGDDDLPLHHRREQLSSGERQAEEAAVRRLAVDALEQSVRARGLGGVPEETLRRWLADAASIDANGFDGIEDAALRDALVGRWGVLRDRARSMTRNTTLERCSRRKRVWRVLSTVPRAGDEVVAVPNDHRGRYVMPPAYRAMFLAWCVGGLPRVECRDDAEGAERLLRQWGAALQLSVAEGSTARQLATRVCGGVNAERGTKVKGTTPLGRNRSFTGRKVAASCWSDTATPAAAPRERRAAGEDYPEPPLARVALGSPSGKAADGIEVALFVGSPVAHPGPRTKCRGATRVSFFVPEGKGAQSRRFWHDRRLGLVIALGSWPLEFADVVSSPFFPLDACSRQLWRPPEA